MKNWKKIMTGLGLGLLTAAVAFSGNKISEVFAADKDRTIAEGVYIGAVNVGGMTAEEASAAVENYISSLNERTFTLSGAAGSMNISAEDMCVTADIDAAVEDAMAVGRSGNLISRFKTTEDLKSEPLTVNMHLSIDKEATAHEIYDNLDTLNVDAVDNSLEKTTDGFEFIEGSIGQEVDVKQSVYAINDFLANEWDGVNDTIDLVVDVIEPGNSREELETIQDCLGSYTTDFSSSAAGRAQNVKNGVSKLNGIILQPGEELSVYKTVSPFTEENGYELAGSYENGTVVETFGGGICQVSTTLYNAVIRAELQVTKRYNHSMLVHYVEPSEDAAIAGELKDFRFVNSLDTPIYIEGYCENGKVYFNIYGKETRPANRKVTFESETIEELEPETKYVYDSEQNLGYIDIKSSTSKGVVARLWKIVTVDGEEESREVFNNSNYKASPRTVTIGTKGATYSQLAAIQSAAASGDESKARSLALQYANDNANAKSYTGTGSTGGSSTGGSSTGGSSTGGSSTGGTTTGGDTTTGTDSSSDDSGV